MDMHENVGAKRLSRMRAESGQAIVLLALVMVALIGITGLAVDGGGMFFLQRDAQNAADAAAVAAAYARCTIPNTEPSVTIGLSYGPAPVIEAGQEAARQNGFNDGEGGRTVAVITPPINGPKAGVEDYVEVDITATKPSYFIQAVYQGALQVSVRAIGFCQPEFDPATVPAIFGISDQCTNTVKWGGATVDIEGGVFSNNDMQFNGSSGTIDGGANAVTHVDNSDNIAFDPPSQSGDNGDPVTVQPDPLALYYQVDQYKPGGEVAVTIPPQYYYAFWQGNDSSADGYDFFYSDGNHTWNPGNNYVFEGVYYVDGSISLPQNYSVGPSGVSFIATGSISSTNAGSPTAPLKYYDGTGSTGVLFFSNYDTTNCGSDAAIGVSGKDTNWDGLVYAPRGAITVSGSNLTLVGAIVGETIQWDASDATIIANPDILTPVPPLVKLSE